MKKYRVFFLKFFLIIVISLVFLALVYLPLVGEGVIVEAIIPTIILGLITWFIILGEYDVNLKGVYITPLQTQILRWVIFFTVVWVISFVFDYVDRTSNETGLPYAVFVFFGVVIGLPFLKKAKRKFRIERNHVGVFTFLDKRYRIFFIEGTYDYYGQIFGFSIYDEGLIGLVTDGEKKGQVYIGRRDTKIFDGPEKEKRTLKVSAYSKDGVPVFCNLTINTEVTDPFRWMLNNDPILVLAEQFRTAWRNIAGLFLVDDINYLKNEIPKIFLGKKVIFAFISKIVEEYDAGSIIRSKSRDLMYFVFDHNEISESEAKAKFMTELETNSNPTFLKNAKDASGNINLSVVSIEELVDVTKTLLGINIINIMLSNIMLPPSIENANMEAAVELKQRKAQRRSTETHIANAGKYVGELKIDDTTAAILAALQDGMDINTLHATGGAQKSELMQAAQILASKKDSEDKNTDK